MAQTGADTYQKLCSYSGQDPLEKWVAERMASTTFVTLFERHEWAATDNDALELLYEAFQVDEEIAKAEYQKQRAAYSPQEAAYQICARMHRELGSVKSDD